MRLQCMPSRQHIVTIVRHPKGQGLPMQGISTCGSCSASTSSGIKRQAMLWEDLAQTPVPDANIMMTSSQLARSYVTQIPCLEASQLGCKTLKRTPSTSITHQDPPCLAAHPHDGHEGFQLQSSRHHWPVLGASVRVLWTFSSIVRNYKAV